MARHAHPSENMTAAELRAVTAQAERLIAKIEPMTVTQLRNRAIIGVMGYAWASIESVIRMCRRDYYCVGDLRWVRFLEDGAERHEIVDRRLQVIIDQYLAAIDISTDPHSPLFPSTLSGGSHKPSSRFLSLRQGLKIIRNALNGSF
jgi:hypothetical protein